ncbi:hypothetical protein NMY22_g19800 [Coprinellus aureogranulatus]|nr:hypothetical protein NMY22_g19800 [Coprinellus aureogranulatus]
MQGTKQEPGVIPRVIQAMFDKQESLTEHEVSLSVSYMEIYKDEVYDLFVPREGAPKLPVRENEVGMVFVANLSSVPISSAQEFDQIYSQATKNRSVGATNLNRHSSRSHAVLTVEATMIDHSNNTTLTGKINLVDLAGSENNKQTGNDSTRMAESAAINKSLSVLGQVVHALNQGASRIPYRNSKLTRILQDALGGNAVGLLICNLAPGVKFRQDTLNTLNFAVRTKNVENKPVINERDNRPQPKPHFSAPSVPPPVGKAATGILLPASTTGPVTVAYQAPDARPANRRRSGRQSLVPVSRVPRVSMGGGGGATGGLYQPFAFPSGSSSGAGGNRRLTTIGEAGARPRLSGSGVGLTAEDIDERISRAVEAEVARRMAEKEKEWQEEQRRLARELEEEREKRERRERAPQPPNRPAALVIGVDFVGTPMNILGGSPKQLSLTLAGQGLLLKKTTRSSQLKQAPERCLYISEFLKKKYGLDIGTKAVGYDLLVAETHPDLRPIFIKHGCMKRSEHLQLLHQATSQQVEPLASPPE